MTPDGSARPNVFRSNPWNTAAVVIALLTVVGLVFLPTGMSSTTNAVTGETSAATTTLIQSQGWGVLMILLVPVLVTAVSLVVRTRTVRLAATILLAGLVVLGAASIGLFFVPTLLVMVVSSIADASTPQPTHQPVT